MSTCACKTETNRDRERGRERAREIERISDELFHVSSTVTVRMRAIHVSPITSLRQAPSTRNKETVNQTDMSQVFSSYRSCHIS